MLPTSLGLIDHDSGQRFLFEATPAVTEQVHALDWIAPPDPTVPGGLGLDGVFLAHAHLGHYLGLAQFGFESASARNQRVFAMPRMAAFLRDLDSWEQCEANNGNTLEALIGRVDYVYVDASFFDDNELPGRDMSMIPHPRTSHTMARLADAAADIRARIHFIHYNHTNPIRDPASAQSKQVLERGFNIARRGNRYCLSGGG